jgi:two-component system sensor histidine kinase RegB
MSLLQVVQESIAPHARRPDVRVEAVVSGPHGETPPEIWRLAEVLHALTAFVENAVDFARSEILVTARFDARFIAVEVRDDGPGFSPSLLPHIFERGTQDEDARSKGQGLGLGLFIVQRLVALQGGAVRVTSGAAGTTFTVALPQGL